MAEDPVLAPNPSEGRARAESCCTVKPNEKIIECPSARQHRDTSVSKIWSWTWRLQINFKRRLWWPRNTQWTAANGHNTEMDETGSAETSCNYFHGLHMAEHRKTSRLLSNNSKIDSKRRVSAVDSWSHLHSKHGPPFGIQQWGKDCQEPVLSHVYTGARRHTGCFQSVVSTSNEKQLNQLECAPTQLRTSQGRPIMIDID